MNALLRVAALIVVALWMSAVQGGNAVREGDTAGFSFCNVASGAPNVTVLGKPMAREGDPINCVEGAVCDDEVTPITGTIGNGSSSVFINGVPAAVSDTSTVEDFCYTASGFGFWPFVEVGS